MNIANGKISWEVVNTKNIDNVGVVIDHGEERTAHNEKNCRYLEDSEEYNRYFKMVCEKIGLGKEMKVIDNSFHTKGLAKSIMIILKQRMQKKQIKGNEDNELMYLLKNDQRKNLIIRSIK